MKLADITMAIWTWLICAVLAVVWGLFLGSVVWGVPFTSADTATTIGETSD